MLDLISMSDVVNSPNQKYTFQAVFYQKTTCSAAICFRSPPKVLLVTTVGTRNKFLLVTLEVSALCIGSIYYRGLTFTGTHIRSLGILSP